MRSHARTSPYRSLVLCIDFADRQKLYDRIDLRVQKMLQRGLEDEARQFFETYGEDSGTARQAIGCKEFLPYFRGEISYAQAVESICRGTRRYAKRQLTWFGRNDTLVRLYADEPGAPPLSERALNAAREFLLKRRLADA